MKKMLGICDINKIFYKSPQKKKSLMRGLDFVRAMALVHLF